MELKVQSDEECCVAINRQCGVNFVHALYIHNYASTLKIESHLAAIIIIIDLQYLYAKWSPVVSHWVLRLEVRTVFGTLRANLFPLAFYGFTGFRWHPGATSSLEVFWLSMSLLVLVVLISLGSPDSLQIPCW